MSSYFRKLEYAFLLCCWKRQAPQTTNSSKRNVFCRSLSASGGEGWGEVVVAGAV